MAIDKQLSAASQGPYPYDSVSEKGILIEDFISGADEFELDHDGITISAWTASKFLFTDASKKTETGDLDNIVTSDDGSITISGNDIAITQEAKSKSFFLTSALSSSGGYKEYTIFDWSGNNPSSIGRCLILAHHWTGSARDGTLDAWIEFVYGKYYSGSRTSFINLVGGSSGSGVFNTDGTGGSGVGLRVFNYITTAKLRIENHTGSLIKLGIMFWNMET